MGKKSTDAEVERRVTDVYNLLLIGTSRAGIPQFASRWDVDARSVDMYIRRAKNQIKKQAAVQRDEVQGQPAPGWSCSFRKHLLPMTSGVRWRYRRN
jgi:hypothetical protein